MGASRSLLGCVNAERESKGQKRSNYTPNSWREALEQWNWQDRARAWDESERKRIEAEFKEDCDNWRVHRFKNANKLREKAESLLAFPVTKQTRAGDDGATYIIEPLSAQGLKDAASVLKTADELARITTQETLPVRKVAPTDPSGEKEYTGGLSPDQRIRLIGQLATAAGAEDSGRDPDE